jgi:hypothetical protein
LLSGTLNAIVMTAPSTPKMAPANSHPLPGWRIWTRATTPTAAANTAAPRYTSRKGALAFASTLIPRIAVIALTGPVRSSPHITKVEKTYIMPAAAALAIAAMEARKTTGLMFMNWIQPSATKTIHC